MYVYSNPSDGASMKYPHKKKIILLFILFFSAVAVSAFDSLVFVTHERIVFGAAFSPSGDVLAAASLDGTVSLWRMDGVLLNKYHLHKAPVYAVVFSPDGRQIASSSADGTIAVFDRKGKVRFRISSHTNKVKTIDWSPDGRYLASGDDGTLVKIHDARNGRFLMDLKKQKQPVNAVAFSPNSKELYVAERGTHLVVYRTVSWKYARSFQVHKSAVWDVAVSRDGKYLATGSKDKSVRVWTPEGKQVRAIEDLPAEVWTLYFSPDSSRVVCGLRDGQVALLDLKSGKAHTVFRSHKTGIPAIAWSPSGALICTGSKDGTLRLWKGR